MNSRLQNTNPRLRVAVLNRNFVSTGGGAERYSIALVEALAAQHDIHVFAQTIDHSWPGVTYHRVSAPFRRPRWVNQLWYATVTWWATRHGFDVVHSHENTWHGNVQTVHVLPIKYSLFAGRKGWRLVLRWCKAVTSLRLLAYLWLEARRFAPRSGRQIIATSDALRDIVARSHPEARNMLSTLTPGIASVHEGGRASTSKQAARHQLGLPAEGQLVLFVANDFRKKGFATLLKALASLAPDVTVAVVGNPAHAKWFAEPVRVLGLQNRVTYLGRLKEVDLAYQAADCLAHPTLEDTFAMVVLEAMSWGLPVVVSGGKYCGISDLLSDGHNALLLADPENADYLAQCLSRVLINSSLRDNMALNAIEFARDHLWSRQAALLAHLYSRAAQRQE